VVVIGARVYGCMLVFGCVSVLKIGWSQRHHQKVISEFIRIEDEASRVCKAITEASNLPLLRKTLLGLYRR